MEDLHPRAGGAGVVAAQPASSSVGVDRPGEEGADERPEVVRRPAGRGWSGRLPALLLGVYPFVVYLALAELGPRGVAGLLVLLASVRLLPRLAGRGSDRDPLAGWHAAALLGLGVVVFASGLGRFALVLPVAVNLGLLAYFAHSLRSGDSVVEAIAIRWEGAISDEKRAYCRSVTRVWCVFFAVNATVAAALALWAPVSWWTLYNGAIAYGLMAALFGVEFFVRRHRFPGEASRADWTRVAEKGSETGLRIIWWVCRVLGRPAVRTLVRGVTLYYVCSDAELRRVSREFQRRVGRTGSFGDVYGHVLRFAFCIVDRLFLLSGRTDLFEIESNGDELLRATLERGQGAILVGAHFGSFEALRAAARGHAFPLSIVGFFENAQRINALLASLGPDLATRVIHVDPKRMTHMMQIRERVRAGELVGFLGDRMAPGAEGVRVPVHGCRSGVPDRRVRGRGHPGLPGLRGVLYRRRRQPVRDPLRAVRRNAICFTGRAARARA